MFEQILKALKTKYKDLGLGEIVLKVYANKLAKTVKEENEIETAVAEVEDELKLHQSYADQIRTQKAELDKLKAGKPQEGGEPTPPAPKPAPKPEGGDDVPAWADAIIKSNEALTAQVTALQAERKNQSNGEKLISKLKELGVNESFYKMSIQGKQFETDEEINAFANSLKEAEDEYLQSTNNGRLKDTENPSFGSGLKGDEVSPAVQAMFKTEQK